MYKGKIFLLASFAILSATNMSFAGSDSENGEQFMDSSKEMTAGSGMMGEGMLAIPQMDPASGRVLFAEKGCVVCHSVNSIGGEDAPALDATGMPPMMNPFDFAAKMWRGAETMVAMQRDELGAPIEITGQELADIIAFVHSPKEQSNFKRTDIPEKIEKLLEKDD